jgi:hypothetical protein
MLFSVGDSGAPLGGGALVVAVVVAVVVVLLVVGVWLPLVPQAVVNVPIAMSTAPPATASRRRSTLRAFMRNSYLRVNFPAGKIRATVESEYCSSGRILFAANGLSPRMRAAQRSARPSVEPPSSAAQVPASDRIIGGQPVCEQWGVFIVAYGYLCRSPRRP